MVLIKDGDPVFVLERRHIEGRSSSAIAADLRDAYATYCGPDGADGARRAGAPRGVRDAGRRAGHEHVPLDPVTARLYARGCRIRRRAARSAGDEAADGRRRDGDGARRPTRRPPRRRRRAGAATASDAPRSRKDGARPARPRCGASSATCADAQQRPGDARGEDDAGGRERQAGRDEHGRLHGRHADAEAQVGALPFEHVEQGRQRRGDARGERPRRDEAGEHAGRAATSRRRRTRTGPARPRRRPGSGRRSRRAGRAACRA